MTIAALFCSCTREAPQETGSFMLEFEMPDGCSPNVFYSGRTVQLKGELEYEYETDICGMVKVPSIIPGIYDIVSKMEISGAEYKEMLQEKLNIEDNARVILGVSLMNQRIFQAEDLKLKLNASVLKSIIISKIYYSGTRDNMDRTYTSDSYVELFNNSDETAYLDGLCLALAESVSPAAYPAKENPDSVYARQICRFPGNGKDYPLEPGKSVVIAAKSARNHLDSAPVSVDLSAADFEVKLVEGSGNPDVPMLPLIHNSTTVKFFNLLSGGPNALFLIQTDEDVLSWPEVYQRGKTSGELFRRVHKSFIIDGVECLKKPSQTAPDVNTKRLQNDIDAGYMVVSSVNGYTHESVERKISRYENGRYYLEDTNNSSADFVVCTNPTPRVYDKEGLK